jgi:hypothetical protein
MKKTLTTHNDVYSGVAQHIMHAQDHVIDGNEYASSATMRLQLAHRD